MIVGGVVVGAFAAPPVLANAAPPIEVVVVAIAVKLVVLLVVAVAVAATLELVASQVCVGRRQHMM